ncbi:Txe/YoeB family addiction module toxin [Mucilaginibacter mali]|uniref:Putative mRNA interferase YoeB n=1 Tax=Mucilaginibacter mali TaxID=2740462 RepID=A0A7D4QMS6_9SPHI|nr:Txe/YoeB family addiction module toxin [Mucilaginibacter mali]QKJ32050.1 Txe/YoeB family addiction module toxin [Mucilaginibacter mali]
MEALSFTSEALADLEYWKKSGNVIILKRIRQLVEAIQLDPFAGIGKPEALKHNLAGFWSRRINQEHRLVYKVESETIVIYSLRFHYTR